MIPADPDSGVAVLLGTGIGSGHPLNVRWDAPHHCGSNR